MNVSAGRRHKRAIAIHNVVDYDSNNNPIGLKEDRSNSLSANFGTERNLLRGGCYLWDSDNYLEISASDGDIESVSALDEDGTIISLTATFDTDHYEIKGTEGEYAWNIKCWANGVTPTDDQKSSYVLEGSGGQSNLFAWFHGSEHSGAVCYDSSGNGNHGQIMNAITTTPEEDSNSIHQYQDIYSFENEEGYTLSTNTYIPKDASITLPPFKDILGNNLQYQGKVPGKIKFVQSNCWLGDGTSYLSITGLLTTDTIEVFGSSDIPTCTIDGQLDLGSSENAYGVGIYRSSVLWAYLSLCEPIINLSSHTYYDVSGNGNHAVLTDGTVANEGKQDEFHYLQKGFLKEYVNNNSLNYDFNDNIDNTTLGNDYGSVSTKSHETTDPIRGLGSLRIDISIGAENRPYLLVASNLTGTQIIIIQFKARKLPTSTIVQIWGFYFGGQFIELDTYEEITEEVKLFTFYPITWNYTTNKNVGIYINQPEGESTIIIDDFCITTVDLAEYNYVPLLADKSKFANGIDLGNEFRVLQDGKSFLNTRTKLQAYDYPSLKQADKDNDFFYDTDGNLRQLEFGRFLTENPINSQYHFGKNQYSTDENIIGITNISIYPKALNAKQEIIEKIVRDVYEIESNWLLKTGFLDIDGIIESKAYLDIKD